MEQTKPTISLTLIVKNEEQTLARCLDGLAPIMDEIIIVDTGSTDATKAIASRYTEKVFDYEWCDDFAAARNFAMSKATCDYIYMADADEVLDEANQQRFHQLKQALLPEIDIVQMKYCNQLEFGSVYNYDEEYRPKLLKRIRQFQYMDPIHETIRVEPIVYDSDIEIQHKPHESHAKRDFMYFQKAIQRGERLSKRILNMYVKELYIAGEKEDFLQAQSCFESVLEDSSRETEEILEASLVLTRIARYNKDIHNFMKFALKLASTSPCSELCYELGEYFYEQSDYQEASIWFYNAAYETECRVSIQYAGEMVLHRLADCYEAIGDLEQCQEYRRLAEGV